MRPFARPGTFIALAALVGAAFGGPQADARAAAATAGTLFEAAPFLLAAFWLERLARTRPAFRIAVHGAGIAGCGCAHGPVPGALALPAIALSALAFGPFVAAARVLTGLALLAARAKCGPGPVHRLKSDREPAGDDPLRALEQIGAGAFVASLAVAAFSAHAAALPWPCLFLGGAVLGALAPCATAGVAIAAAFAHVAPAASAGMLATAGLATISLPQAARGPAVPARAATVLLGLACAALALRGPSGLVNPRLLVPLALASAVAFATYAVLRTRSAWPPAAPILMLGIAAAPPALPPPRADATRLDEAYAGEPLAFAGVTSRNASGTTLARYAITCCRIDASAVAVRLDRTLDVPDGRWIDARGTLVRDANGTLVLHARDVRNIVAPADPFVYR